MANKLFSFGDKSLNRLFNFFFFLTLFFAVTSPNIILGDNKITGAGTTMFTTLVLIVMVALVICFLTYPQFHRWCYQVFVVRKLWTASFLMMMVILWQIVFVLNVHPAIGFDVGAIHEALTNTTNPEIKAYFSLNYNNMPILLAELFLSHAFETKTWLFFDLVTVLLVDVSALLNILSVAVLARKKVAAAMYLHIFWLLLFPMIIVPYTDTWVLPFVSGYLFCYVVLTHSAYKWPWKVLAALGFGVTVIGAYFMKPSAIVGVIAIILVEFLYSLKPHKWKLQTKLLISMMAGCSILAAGGTYVMGNHVISQQKHIQVNTAREIPAIHFISMGVSGDGGYNAKDALKMAEIPTKQGRVTYSKKMWLKRLKQKGVLGYLIFLVEKQRNNTSDGSFAWVKEGHFINENPKPNGTGFAGELREFVYLYGTRLGDLRFLSQLWWIVWLVLIAFGWRHKSKMAQVLRVMILGGFAYLLLFEGGRSRYLIQFLPAFLILAALVYQETFTWFGQVYRWANGIGRHNQ